MPEIAHEISDPDLSDIIRHLLKLGSDFEWDEVQIATAVSGVVAPIAGADSCSLRDNAASLTFMARQLIQRVETFAERHELVNTDLHDLLSSGPGLEEKAAEVLARNLQAGFGDIPFMRMEGVVLRALEIVQDASRAEAT